MAIHSVRGDKLGLSEESEVLVKLSRDRKASLTNLLLA